jgi:hypothetical protein
MRTLDNQPAVLRLLDTAQFILVYTPGEKYISGSVYGECGCMPC